MKIDSLPFNIKLLNFSADFIGTLKPVTSLNIYETDTKDFHPEGLYSNTIFGQQGDSLREVAYSYINLNIEVFTPLYYKILVKTKGLYEGIMMSREYARWDDDLKDFVAADFITGDTGFAFFSKHWLNIEHKQTNSAARKLNIEFLTKFRDIAMTKAFTVIPAALRELQETEEGRPEEDDINGLYRRVIAGSNTINPHVSDPLSNIFDSPRIGMQKAINEIYEYIYLLISGKNGLIQARWGSRKVLGSNRNVISGAELGADQLGSPKQHRLDVTQIGLSQFIDGYKPLVQYAIRNEHYRDFFENVSGEVTLIDRNTHEPKRVILKDKTAAKWGTKEGLSKLASGFEDVTRRHKPVVIDGHFLGLIYEDSKKGLFKQLHPGEAIPDGFDKANVRPITYAEFWFIHCTSFMDKARAFTTRFPVTGLGSTYPTKIYLRTTITGNTRTQLTDNWETSEIIYYEFPNTAAKEAFLETQVLHTAFIEGLGADYDGDMLSNLPVWSNEAMAEINAMLNSKSLYLSPTGGLTLTTVNDVQAMVLASLTGNGK